MKKILTLLIAIPLFCNAQLTQDLYGLYLGDDNSVNSDLGVGLIDPETAQVTYQASFVDANIHALGDHAVDPIHHCWFEVWGDSINMYLSNYNMDNGNLNNILFTADSVGNGQSGTVTIGGEIGGTFYNCRDDAVYFFHFKAPWEAYVHFAKADRTTGAITELDSFPLGIQPIDNFVVPSHQIAYWLAYDPVAMQYDSLVSYDLASLTHSSILMSEGVPTSDFWELTYNPADGLLYGLQEDLDSFSYNNYLADLRYIKIDPETGIETDLTTDFLGNILYPNVTLDFNTDKINVAIQTQNPGYPQIASYDILGGTSVINNVSYTGFGNILGPSLLGIDPNVSPKDCPTATGEEAISDCNDPIATVIGNQNPALHFGCHWKDYLGMQLIIYDEWGRRISNQTITGQFAEINMRDAASQMYFYSIVDKGEMKASGKLMVAK